MTGFLIYQGKVAIALAAFYMCYRLLLSKETFHRFNRIVLLGTAALAFVLPLCVITVNKTVILSSNESVTMDVEPVEGIAYETAAMSSEDIWAAIFLCIFIIGALTVVLMTAISIIKVMSIIRSGEQKVLEGGETLVITENGTAPFSWMKYIVLSRGDYESGCSQILTHEKAHIALRHSWDLLFVDLVTVLQWFNPVIWMLKSDLRAIHEFEADDAVLRSGANIKEYQYLLIKKAVGKSGYSVANSFNHSILKTRITMMSNKKSSRMSAWKALYVLPLVGLSLAATAETKVDYRYEDQLTRKAGIVEVQDTSAGKDSKKSFKEKNMKEGHFIIDEEGASITMVYFDHNGNEMRSTIVGLDLGSDVYLCNGSLSTPRAFEIRMQDEDVVLLNAYMGNGKKVMGAVLPNNDYTTGTWDVNRNPDEQETVHHIDDTLYQGKDLKTVEISQSDLVFVVNGERMPEGFDLNTIKRETIESLNVMKSEQAMKEYGTDKGVILIQTKPVEQQELKPARLLM